MKLYLFIKIYYIFEAEKVCKNQVKRTSVLL